MPHDTRRNTPYRRPRARRHARGAVLLLAVYLIALVFLLLGGVFLQRTNIEMLSVQQMRNVQQAFYLAEGALDWALADVAQTPSRTDGRYDIPNLPQGTASYTLTTDSDPTLRTIHAVGTFATLTQRVNATFRTSGTPYPQEGFWANRVRVGRYNENMSAYLTGSPLLRVAGTIRSAFGIEGSVELYHVLVDGLVSAGPSQTTTVGPFTYPGYSSLFLPGFPYDEQTGINTWPGLVPQLTQNPQEYPMELPQRIDPHNDPLVDPSLNPGQCQPDGVIQGGIRATDGNLFLKNSQRLIVRDGDTLDGGDALDLDPTPGRILLCLQTLVLDGHSKLTFTSPATIYLAGYVDPLNDPRYNQLLDHFTGLTIGNSVAFAQNQKTSLQAVSGTGAGTPAYDNGVELVVPEWAARKPSPWGRTSLMFVGGTFHGSVAAPTAGVQAVGGERFNPVRIVADYIYYAGTATEEPSITRTSDLVLKQSPGDGTPNPQLSSGARPTVLSWTNASSSSP